VPRGDTSETISEENSVAWDAQRHDGGHSNATYVIYFLYFHCKTFAIYGRFVSTD